jgi:hypothetical protein
MRPSKAFILGEIMGAAVVWLWGREMEEHVEGGRGEGWEGAGPRRRGPTSGR